LCAFKGHAQRNKISNNKNKFHIHSEKVIECFFIFIDSINSLTNPSGWTKTYYVRDATGNVMSTYEEVPTINAGHYSLAEQHIYGNSRTGMRSI